MFIICTLHIKTKKAEKRGRSKRNMNLIQEKENLRSFNKCFVIFFPRDDAVLHSLSPLQWASFLPTPLQEDRVDMRPVINRYYPLAPVSTMSVYARVESSSRRVHKKIFPLKYSNILLHLNQLEPVHWLQWN